MSRYNKYLYLEPKDNVPIIVYAKNKPSIKNIPRSGAWVVREYINKIEGWCMPCFPEITWHYLRTFIFIGKVKEND